MPLFIRIMFGLLLAPLAGVMVALFDAVGTMITTNAFSTVDLGNYVPWFLAGCFSITILAVPVTAVVLPLSHLLIRRISVSDVWAIPLIGFAAGFAFLHSTLLTSSAKWPGGLSGLIVGVAFVGLMRLVGSRWDEPVKVRTGPWARS